MADLYEGKPDARQAGNIKPSRFRPQYRALTDEEKALHDAIKSKADELAQLFEDGDSHFGRYHELAMTALEQAVMWKVKEITS